MASPGENPKDYRAAPAADERPGMPQVMARQGVTGHNVRQVLGFSLAAIVIAFAIIYIIYFA